MIGINLIVGLLHISNPSKLLPHELSVIYHSYFMDLVLPFSSVLLLSLIESKNGKHLPIPFQVMFIFVLGSFAETMQFFGFEFLGATFDPWDIVMYGIGAGLGGVFERWLAKK